MTEFVVTSAHGLFYHTDGAAWTHIGGDGTIQSVSAVAPRSGGLIAFVVTQDHALFSYGTSTGWREIGGPGSIQAASAGTDSGGQAAVWVQTTAGDFTEFRGSSGWLPAPVGARGTILQFSAGNNDRVSVVTADHSVFEYSGASGWLRRTGSGFAQSVSTVTDVFNNFSVLAVTQNGALYRHDDGIGWTPIGGAGTVAAASAGLDSTGRAEAWVVSTNSVFYEFSAKTGWQRLGTASMAAAVSGSSQGMVAATAADGSVLEYSDAVGWNRLTGTAFAEAPPAPPVDNAAPVVQPGPWYHRPASSQGSPGNVQSSLAPALNGASAATVAAAADQASSGSTAAISLSSTTWTPIGPAPILKGQTPGSMPVTGRIAALAADPKDVNTIYIAAAGGGVWKTTDGGSTWTALTDNQSTLYMGAIAVTPSDSNTIYAGTGEANNSADSFYGRGVLKSTDAGTTWILEGQNNFDRRTISKIAVDPTTENTLYVAVADEGVNGLTGNTGIWKSTDGGATFTNTTKSIPNLSGTDDFTDVVIDPTTPQTVYAAIGTVVGAPANGVYKSTNGGGTWTAAGNFPGGSLDSVIRVAISPSTPQTLYAAVTDPFSFGLRSMQKSTDGGATWATLTSTPNYLGSQGFYDSTLAVDPTNANTVYAGGAGDPTATGSLIIRSTDGGQSWIDISGVKANTSGPHADHHGIGFDANGKLLVGTDGGIWRLDNPSSVTWSDLNGNLQITEFIGAALNRSDPNIAYGGSQDNGVEKFTGSLPWTHIQFGDSGFVRVDFNNPSTVYHTFPFSQGPYIERSNNGGTSWVPIINGIDNLADGADFYPPIVMDPNNPHRLFTGTDDLYETTDQGNVWNLNTEALTGNFNNNSNNIDAIAISKSDPNTLYVTATGEIDVTHDDGANWAVVNIPGFTDHFQDMEVDPTNANVAYAIRDRFGGSVFKTTNGGTTWTNITGNLPDLPAYKLLVNPSNGTLYVGNDNGVFASVNGGASWAPAAAGMPNVQVHEMDISTTTGILLAGTYGRGMWELSLGGGGGGGGPPIGEDRFEPNETSDKATQFGVETGPLDFPGLTITTHANGLPDYDWYEIFGGVSGTFTVTIKIQPVQGDIELHLFTITGSNTLTELSNSTAPGVTTRTLTAPISLGEPMLVEVKGRPSAPGVFGTGFYEMTLNIS
jgi:photosystem II stability/assembly factor-like uncharacterized protein